MDQNLKKELENSQKSFSSFKSRNVNEIFEIKDVIGKGTFGLVSRAILKSNRNEIYALKKILLENEKIIGFPLTAIREIAILNKYKHENLSNLVEVLTSSPASSNKYRGSVYLAFKYMDHDLYGLIHSGQVTFTLPQIKNIIFQILKGVQYLHSNSVLHRDLKSSNILINNQGEVKITDFGLSKKYSSSIRKPYTNGVVTLWYRAPEILLGSTNYNMSVDMWSVGCIFIEILLQTPPFTALVEKELFFQINEQLGAIRENNFPGVSNLPLYEKFKVQNDFYSENKLKKALSRKYNTETVDLAMKLLEIDPRKRISADNALKHNFFEMNPLKCGNNELPKLETHFHELNIRNGDHKKTSSSNNIENLSTSVVESDMKVGKIYDNNCHNIVKNNKEPLGEDSLLKKKRKNNVGII